MRDQQAEVAELIGAMTRRGRSGIVSTPLDETPTDGPSKATWVVPQGMPSLQLRANDLLDEEVLRESLREWADYESIDSIVLFPPLGPVHGTRYQMSELAIRSVVSVVRPEVSLICLTTAQVVGRMRTGSPFEEALRRRSITAVVEVFAERIAVGIYPSLKMVFSRFESSPAGSGVDFVSTSRDTNLSEIADELDQMAAGARRTEHGFVLNAPLPADRGFLPSVLDPARVERVDQASVIGELVRWGDLFEVVRPVSPLERPTNEEEQGKVPAVTGRSLRRGSSDLEATDQWITPGDADLLVEGDLVLAAVVNTQSGVRVARYRLSNGPMVAAVSVLVARPKRTISESTIRVLISFIRSSRFLDQLDSVQSGSIHVRRRELDEVLVPMPDAALTEAFEAVEAAKSQFRSWHEEADGLMELSMEAEDLGLARRNLLDGSGLLRQRAYAAGMLDDLGHRVATRYPLPIAYRYRVALAEKGGMMICVQLSTPTKSCMLISASLRLCPPG